MIKRLGRQWRRIGLTLITLAVAAAILGALLYRERAVLLAYDWDLKWRNLALALPVLVGGLLLAAYIWGDIMRTVGSRAPMSLHVRYYALSQLARRLPGTLWYVVGRGYLYRRHGDSVRLVTLASGLELIVSVASGALFTLALAGYVLAGLPRYYGGGLVLTALLGLAAMHPRFIRYLLIRIGREDAPFIPYPRLIGWLVGYAVLWCVGGFVLYLIADAVYPLPLSTLPYLAGSFSLMGTLSVLVFFLPSNFGFTEVGLSLLLSALVPSSFAVLIAVLNRVLVMLYELIGLGLIMLIGRINGADSSSAPSIQADDPTAL
ncbi:MAG: hypothetical protein H6642_14450 [Caldilineaceae bacterium]|nr:hypothetical protein [Caldilineaceae bacterium]